MAIKSRLRSLEHKAGEDMTAIPQPGGRVERFTEREMAAAFLNAFYREVGRASALEEHPACTAARNSSEAAWRNSVFVGDPPEHEIEDLSEKPERREPRTSR